jgi:hypothetical protein
MASGDFFRRVGRVQEQVEAVWPVPRTNCVRGACAATRMLTWVRDMLVTSRRPSCLTSIVESHCSWSCTFLTMSYRVAFRGATGGRTDPGQHPQLVGASHPLAGLVAWVWAVQVWVQLGSRTVVPGLLSVERVSRLANSWG